MLLFTLSLALVSRVYVLRLLRSSGCDMDAMDRFVLDDERSDLEDENKAERISYKELKDAIYKIQTSEKVKEEHKTETRPTLSKAGPGRVSGADSSVARIHHRTESHATPFERFRNSSSDATTVLGACSVKAPAPVQQRESEKYREDRVQSAKRRDSMTNRLRRLQLLHAGIKSGIFFFDSPSLYFFCRDTSNLLLCLFFSFYLMTFAPTAGLTNNPFMWAILPLLCLCVALGCQVYTIRSSSLIFSFYKLDPEILGRVVEEKEELGNIERLLREKLLNKISNATAESGDSPEMALMKLFNDIQCLDGEEDGFISPGELRVLLQRLNIHFTAKRFEDAFMLLDAQADGCITLMEFHAFVFPADATAKNRLQRIQKMAEIGHMPMPEHMQAKQATHTRQRRTGTMQTKTVMNNSVGWKAEGVTSLNIAVMEGQDSSKSNLSSSSDDKSTNAHTEGAMQSSVKKIYRLLSGMSSRDAVAVGPDNDGGEAAGGAGVPFTVASMRDIESGDAWGHMFTTDAGTETDAAGSLVKQFSSGAGEDGPGIAPFPTDAATDFSKRASNPAGMGRTGGGGSFGAGGGPDDAPLRTDSTGVCSSRGGFTGETYEQSQCVGYPDSGSMVFSDLSLSVDRDDSLV
jgi:hypothetical protein